VGPAGDPGRDPERRPVGCPGRHDRPGRRRVDRQQPVAAPI